MNTIALNRTNMCLEKISKRKIATKDIVCYKKLTIVANFKDSVELIKDNDEFEAIICGNICNGMINKENREIYLCTNEPEANGNMGSTTKGFEYSWYLDEDVTSLVIDGKELITVTLKTPYQHSPITIGKTYISELIVEGDGIYVGLHSFAKLIDAKNDGDKKYVFVKYIIPKNSNYFTGRFNNVKSYASDKLTYVKQVK